MARLSDIIENLLKEMIEENQGFVEITRSELAQKVNCVPSQITYVLSTRFTSNNGYSVESRRGGGGCIRIERISDNSLAEYIKDLLYSIGDSISQQQAKIYVNNLLHNKLLKISEAELIMAALNDKALNIVGNNIVRNILRAKIFKSMLVQLVINYTEEQDL